MPCCEYFDLQSIEYQTSIFPEGDLQIYYSIVLILFFFPFSLFLYFFLSLFLSLFISVFLPSFIFLSHSLIIFRLFIDFPVFFSSLLLFCIYVFYSFSPLFFIYFPLLLFITPHLLSHLLVTFHSSLKPD